MHVLSQIQGSKVQLCIIESTGLRNRCGHHWLAHGLPPAFTVHVASDPKQHTFFRLPATTVAFAQWHFHHSRSMPCRGNDIGWLGDISWSDIAPAGRTHWQPTQRCVRTVLTSGLCFHPHSTVSAVLYSTAKHMFNTLTKQRMVTFHGSEVGKLVCLFSGSTFVERYVCHTIQRLSSYAYDFLDTCVTDCHTKNALIKVQQRQAWMTARHLEGGTK